MRSNSEHPFIRVGLAPGTLLSEAAAGPVHVRRIVYGPDGLEEDAQPDLGRLGEEPAEGRVAWILVEGQGDVDVLRRVGDAVGVPPLVLEDVVNAPQRPKVEELEDARFVVVRDPRQTEDGCELPELAIYARGPIVVSFQQIAGGAPDILRRRLQYASSQTRAKGPEYLVYRLVDVAVDAFFPVLDTIADELEELEDSIMARPSPECLRQLHRLRRRLRSLLRVALPLSDATAALARPRERHSPPWLLPYLRDVHDHAAQVLALVDHYRAIVGDVRELGESAINLRLNQAMRALATVSTIFLPLSFVAALYGMNFDRDSPWNMPELGWRYAYPVLLLFLLAVATAMYLWFSCRGYTRFEEEE